MINTWLLEEFKGLNRGGISSNHPFLTYNSLVEEALKLSLDCYFDNSRLVVVKENSYLAQRLYTILKSFFDDKELVLYLPEDSLRNEAIVASFENKANRLNALNEILHKTPKLIITSSIGLIRHLPDVKTLSSNTINLKVNDQIDKKELVEKLRRIGYESVLNVDTPLTYSERGMVVDVYSTNYDNPLRIEFFDDFIDSIRFFDIGTKRTIKTIDYCEILFASDVVFTDIEIEALNRELTKLNFAQCEIDRDAINNHRSASNLYPYLAYFENAHLLDYCEGYSLYLSNTQEIFKNYKFIHDETVAYIQEMYEAEKLPLKFSVFADLNHILDNHKSLKGENFFNTFSEIEEVELPLTTLTSVLSIIEKESFDSRVLLSVETNELENIVKYFTENNISYHLTNKDIKEGINILVSSLYEGFEIKYLRLKVYTSKEIFNHQKYINKFSKAYNEAASIDTYEELNVGDFVVHNEHGVGKYLGINQKTVDGVKKDYLTIVYAGNATLYVPLSQFSLVKKFVSASGYTPKLNKLGSKDWKETKRKAEENINDIAEELINLYSLRNQKIGFKHSPDDEYQLAFEKEFPYVLTDDQDRSIKEIKKDMESDKPMDRLLCGDVAFGKTEVAIRAAMKAVLSGKQVSYLCPTTVLSLQHYNTFKERFKNYPVRVELINRYIEPKRQAELITDIRLGKIDIVIGTHRLLSNDIVFNDLGLLIVDEEQRFGVKHKEKIKEIKNDVDVLSLSATPIPRTLQMSLVGIRSLSTLSKAPSNRYPIQTYVVEQSDDLIKSVISRELSRNGQVFFLHNNTETIFIKAKQIKDAIPYANVSVVHGQMSREQIEDTMMSFYRNEANVLVCTTIVETGLDIPNANTIIIENAQNFGLSQLYQIKGRVGRSDRIAYAYLLIPPNKQINETSQKRLNAIKEFTTLGSGYKIALRDLTIRGAGDLLGEEQSGFINEIGFELYMDLLNTAIKTKKGEVVEKPKEIKRVNVPTDSYIPVDFSNNDIQKLNIYQKLETINNDVSLVEYKEEITDEFGKLPKAVEAIFNNKKIELLVNQDVIESFKILNGKVTLTVTKDLSDKLDGLKLFEFITHFAKDTNISYKNFKIVLVCPNDKDSIDDLINLAGRLNELKRVETNEN